MIRVYELAVLTFKEGIRDRALLGITIVAMLMLLSTIIITGLYAHQLGKVLLDLNLSTIAFSGLLLTFFVNINLMAKDIDKRTIYCVLSKPLSRTEYIIGKYLGLILLIGVCTFALYVFSSCIVALVKETYPEYYFNQFSWCCYGQAVFYQMLMFLILNAVVIFFSSITTSSFLTLIFSIATYITGHTIEEVIAFFNKEAVAAHAEPSKVHEFFVEFIQYLLPNLSAFDIKTLASHGKLVSMNHTLAVTGYCAIYTALLLFFSILIFNRREFT